MKSRFIQHLSFLCTFVALSFFSNAQIKPTTAAERLKGLEKRKELERSSLVSKVEFRNIGPTIMSGRITDIEVNPDDPTEFYAAYATDGLWHTTNNGQSFIPIFDNSDNLFMGDIAVDWKSRTIWVGTGEVNSSRSTLQPVLRAPN